MALYINKYGGSSVATLEQIQALAKQVAAQAKLHQIVVVVSAMQGETDRLLGLYKAVCANGALREKAMLTASAEQVSATLFALALQNEGVSAQALTGGQAGIITSTSAVKADITHINTDRLTSLLSENSVAVVCGFQGQDPLGNITTLGRGGSDLTAVALSQALAADECRIYTDVKGIYSADPRVVKGAVLLEKISYAEMLEHAVLGAKVMQRQAVEYGGRFNVPIRVLSSTEHGQGTLIQDDSSSLSTLSKVSGVAFDRYQGRITVSGLNHAKDFEKNLRADLLSLRVDVDLLMTHRFDDHSQDIKFTVHLDDIDIALQSVRRLSGQFSYQDVCSQCDVAKLSIIGTGMNQQAKVASQILELLSEHHIEVQLLASSHSKVSVVIAQNAIETAAELLHAKLMS